MNVGEGDGGGWVDWAVEFSPLLWREWWERGDAGLAIMMVLGGVVYSMGILEMSDEGTSASVGYYHAMRNVGSKCSEIHRKVLHVNTVRTLRRFFSLFGRTLFHVPYCSVSYLIPKWTINRYLDLFRLPKLEAEAKLADWEACKL